MMALPSGHESCMSDCALPRVVVHDLYMEEIEVYKHNFFLKDEKNKFFYFFVFIPKWLFTKGLLNTRENVVTNNFFFTH